MRRATLWLAVSASAHAALTLDGVPAPPASLAGKVQEYLEGRDAQVLGWSPADELLVSTRFSEVAQLHLVAQAGGTRQQLTFGPDPVTAAAFSPDPQRRAFWFLRSRGGDGRDALYYQRLGEFTARRLDDPAGVASHPVWSNSGQWLVYASTARTGVDPDLWRVDPEAGAAPQLLVAGDGADWQALDWAPDDHLVLAVRRVGHDESHLMLIDAETGAQRELDPPHEPRRISAARFGRDGAGVYYLADGDSEFQQLRYTDIFTGKKGNLSGDAAGDVTALALGADGHYLAYVKRAVDAAGEPGAARLNLIDLVQHQDLTVPRLPGSVLPGDLAFDAGGKRVALTATATQLPGDAYVVDIAGNSVTAWTRSESGPVDPAGFPAPRAVRVPTFDRDGPRPREIPLLAYEGSGAGARPVLVLFGDPGTAAVRYMPWIGFLARELGFTVLAPQVRGGSGSGKSWRRLGEGMRREDAIKDIGALLVWIRAQKSLDGNSVFVAGEGEGGSLALAALVNYGERLRGGIVAAGITDFVSWLGGLPPEMQRERRARFGDEREPRSRAWLQRISPQTSSERLSRPLLLIHGEQDREVPVAQSTDLMLRVRAHGGTVWYLGADDEGHGFRQRHNQIALWEASAQFLETWR